MRKLLPLLLLLPLTFAAACGGKQVIRDRIVYETEIQFADNVVMEQHGQLRAFIDEHCLCAEEPAALCEEALETWAVVESRWQWHSDMMRYNGQLTDEDPGQAPDFIDLPVCEQ